MRNHPSFRDPGLQVLRLITISCGPSVLAFLFHSLFPNATKRKPSSEPSSLTSSVLVKRVSGSSRDSGSLSDGKSEGLLISRHAVQHPVRGSDERGSGVRHKGENSHSYSYLKSTLLMRRERRSGSGSYTNSLCRDPNLEENSGRKTDQLRSNDCYFRHWFP